MIAAAAWHATGQAIMSEHQLQACEPVVILSEGQLRGPQKYFQL